ncbi:MAG TPA: hypothetical protein VHW65_01095 [Gemmatimonadales bacterium]|nr:hypothetical protein [Gemmatimonadales bacterium]
MEGIASGLLGGAVVAVFYFIIDLMRGRPLMTPSVLGEIFLLRTPLTATPDTAAVLLYTAFHFLVFIALGLFLAALIRAAEHGALARYALVQLLVVFEVFFYGVLSVASEEARGMFPFLGVLAANTLAAITMLAWQWRHHPRLRRAFHREPLGAADHHSVSPATTAGRT